MVVRIDKWSIKYIIRTDWENGDKTLALISDNKWLLAAEKKNNILNHIWKHAVKEEEKNKTCFKDIIIFKKAVVPVIVEYFENKSAEEIKREFENDLKKLEIKKNKENLEVKNGI